MMKHLNKYLSLALALVLCLTLLPAPVRAEETVCICTDRCSEEMVNLDCPICSADCWQASVAMYTSCM